MRGNRRQHVAALLVILLISISGCQNQSKANTFAGFTFGGGGKTFSCEPARWSTDESGFRLQAGLKDEPSHLLLEGSVPLVVGEPLPLKVAVIKVVDQTEEATLIGGELVLQNQTAALAHGSFELTVKLSDGREFKVVGSFTASQS